MCQLNQAKITLGRTLGSTGSSSEHFTQHARCIQTIDGLIAIGRLADDNDIAPFGMTDAYMLTEIGI